MDSFESPLGVSFSSMNDASFSKDMLDGSIDRLVEGIDLDSSEIEPEFDFGKESAIPVLRINSDSSSFEDDIDYNLNVLTGKYHENIEIDRVLKVFWIDIGNFNNGEPGSELAHVLNNSKLDKDGFNEIFMFLNSFLTSITSEMTAFKFYQSSRELNSLLKPAFAHSERLLVQSQNYLVKMIASPIVNALAISIKSESVSNQDLATKECFESMKTQYSNDIIIFKAILHYIDCTISNSVLTDHLLETLSDYVIANTNLTNLESDIKIELPHFRQVLLVILAHDAILNDSSCYESLVPLIPPSFSFLIMCLLKPDSLNTKPIEYSLIENFAAQRGVKFNVRAEASLLNPYAFEN